ncbi:MAG: hypothetical protein KDK66_03850 [Deltaproteobacteria bacterium]|nr:hypothetical protein [Deltaproteobacteria bacterium]
MKKALFLALFALLMGSMVPSLQAQTRGEDVITGGKGADTFATENSKGQKDNTVDDFSDKDEVQKWTCTSSFCICHGSEFGSDCMDMVSTDANRCGRMECVGETCVCDRRPEHPTD